ncbi:hypothetical protein J6590_010992 [Homalodisca vitripennis]|nr:hypothetical protein J6590_010992 [Homalodisca vitripennis]
MKSWYFITSLNYLEEGLSANKVRWCRGRRAGRGALTLSRAGARSRVNALNAADAIVHELWCWTTEWQRSLCADRVAMRRERKKSEKQSESRRCKSIIFLCDVAGMSLVPPRSRDGSGQRPRGQWRTRFLCGASQMRSGFGLTINNGRSAALSRLSFSVAKTGVVLWSRPRPLRFGFVRSRHYIVTPGRDHVSDPPPLYMTEEMRIC